MPGPTYEPMIRTLTSSTASRGLSTRYGDDAVVSKKGNKMKRAESTASTVTQAGWDLAGKGAYETSHDRGMGELYESLRRAIGESEVVRPKWSLDLTTFDQGDPTTSDLPGLVDGESGEKDAKLKAMGERRARDRREEKRVQSGESGWEKEGRVQREVWIEGGILFFLHGLSYILSFYIESMH
jgi:hypothetical protein